MDYCLNCAVRPCHKGLSTCYWCVNPRRCFGAYWRMEEDKVAIEYPSRLVFLTAPRYGTKLQPRCRAGCGRPGTHWSELRGIPRLFCEEHAHVSR